MAGKRSITISSHNLHGYNKSKAFLYSRCEEETYLIQGVQEHWLPPPFKRQAGTNKLRTLHPRYESFATSAMKHKTENEIRRGRGFGGTGFIYPKELTNVLKPIVRFNHARISVMQLDCTESNIIIINAYMPFLDNSRLPNLVYEYSELLGYIDYIINDALFLV